MDHDEFIKESKKLVVNYIGEYLDVPEEENITSNEVYVVWSVKALQNSKALLSTPLSDGMYYEVTLNGDKKEIYFDAYKKQNNICINYEN